MIARSQVLINSSKKDLNTCIMYKIIIKFTTNENTSKVSGKLVGWLV